MIKAARDFVISGVDNPALQSSRLEKKFKNKVQSSKNIIVNFKRVGDLYLYLKKFNEKPTPGKNPLYDSMKALNLTTYEDLLPKFEEKFKDHINDITVLDDFVIGRSYTSWDISIFSRSYNNQSGIYLIGNAPNYQAIFIKATLQGGKYPNEWLQENELLKYYFYSRMENFDLNYKFNKAIINSNDTSTPIYVFIKNDTTYTLSGIFKYIKYEKEPNGSMWSKLAKINSIEIDNLITQQEYEKELDKKLKKSRNSDSQNRKERLQHAPKHPKTIQTVTTSYKRNPDVIIETLQRAKGYCESCKNPAPFIRASDNTPYLEVHHVIPLSKGGEDTVSNTIALCPNCHMKAHFGIKEPSEAINS